MAKFKVLRDFFHQERTGGGGLPTTRGTIGQELELDPSFEAVQVLVDAGYLELLEGEMHVDVDGNEDDKPELADASSAPSADQLDGQVAGEPDAEQFDRGDFT